IRKKQRPKQSSGLRKSFLTMAASRKLLATKPDWRTRLRGDLQMHTQWSDGSAEIREMAHAAMAQGYEFIAITDHSKTLTIANGLDEEALEKQGLEISRINKELGSNGVKLRLLHSVELNLNPSGVGDVDA